MIPSLSLVVWLIGCVLVCKAQFLITFTLGEVHRLLYIFIQLSYGVRGLNWGYNFLKAFTGKNNYYYFNSPDNNNERTWQLSHSRSVQKDIYNVRSRGNSIWIRQMKSYSTLYDPIVSRDRSDCRGNNCVVIEVNHTYTHTNTHDWLLQDSQIGTSLKYGNFPSLFLMATEQVASCV